MLRQIERIAERLRGVAALGDRRQVENGKGIMENRTKSSMGERPGR